MRLWLFLPLLLTACVPKTPVYRDYSPDVQKVNFPRQVNAGQPLTVTLEVLTGGGCNSFNRLEAERTTSQVNLKPVGKTPDYPANEAKGIQVACTTNPDQWQTISYTDSGNEPRHSPFKVLVNGKAQGSAEIR